MKKLLITQVSILVLSITMANAQVLFQDNFAGFTLDTSKWSVLLVNNASVVQNNGSITLNHPLPSKALLTTTVGIDSPFTVTGSFTLQKNGIFGFATRASGQVNPLSYHDPYGLLFSFYDTGPFVPQQRFDLISFSPGQTYNVIDTQVISFDPFATNYFSVTDSGSFVSITLNGVAIDNVAVDANFTEGNKFVIGDGGTWDASAPESSILGPVTIISAVPESSTYTLLAVGCAGLLALRRRAKSGMLHL